MYVRLFGCMADDDVGLVIPPSQHGLSIDVDSLAALGHLHWIFDSCFVLRIRYCSFDRHKSYSRVLLLVFRSNYSHGSARGYFEYV